MDEADRALDFILGRTFDVEDLVGAPKDDEWFPAYSSPKPIKEMSDNHLLNSIRLWRDRCFPDWNVVEQVKDLDLQTKFGDALIHLGAMFKFPKYQNLWKEALKHESSSLKITISNS